MKNVQAAARRAELGGIAIECAGFPFELMCLVAKLGPAGAHILAPQLAPVQEVSESATQITEQVCDPYTG
jgi:hypothetical protein